MHDRAVVRALRALEPLTGPTPTERQRMRDRVLLAVDADTGEPGEPSRPEAVAPPQASTRAEPTARPPGTARGRTRPADRTRPGARRPKQEPKQETEREPKREREHRGVLAGARGRLAIASLALLTLVGSLTGMSVLLARDALPGDALYGVKRTAEAASLGLTFGDEPKALKHLEFAAARVAEIETLARRYADPADAPVGGYLNALTDFDNDATAGSRQLITLATSTDGRLLGSLHDWSAQQAHRLGQVAPRLPAAAGSREIATRALLDRIVARSDALLARMDCFQITSGSYDDIGALPATGTCERKSPAPTTSTPQPSVPDSTDNPGTPGTPTGPEPPSTPLPSAEPTPNVPLVPVPGATVTVPAPTERPQTPNTTIPTTPPLVQLPPLLPGLPGVGIG
jgi:hypothetical protein